MWLDNIRPWQVIALAALIRAALICWAEYQDRHLPVKYTDIDYVVFTDAARFVAAGGSPYKRATYRYSPLLAYLLLPNIWLHPAWGKVLFSASDLAAAGLLHLLLLRSGVSRPLRVAALLLWLFNPYTATISTRGSCDVLSVLLLLAVLLGLLYGAPAASGVFYGLAVHFRIYPVIYSPAVALYLMRRAVVLHGMRQERNAADMSADVYVDGAGAAAGADRSTAFDAVLEPEPDLGAAAAAVMEVAAAGAHADAGGAGLRQRRVPQGGGTDDEPTPVSERLAASVAADAAAADADAGAAAADAAAGADAASLTGPAASQLPPRRQQRQRQRTDGAESSLAEWLPPGSSARGAAAVSVAAAALRPVALFGGASAASFLLLAALFYRLYGLEFLQEAFLHHLSRKDPRHNFSPYYYPVYLSYGSSTSRMDGTASASGPLLLWLRRVVLLDEPWRLALLPQAAALLALALRFHGDLPAAWLLQTWVFVALNKVATAQYFVWYLSLLPLVLPALAAQRAVSQRALAAGGVMWVAAQLHWLAWAYQLEMKGRSVHLALWVASLIFQAANTAAVVLLIRALMGRLRRAGCDGSDDSDGDGIAGEDSGDAVNGHAGAGATSTFLGASLELVLARRRRPPPPPSVPAASIAERKRQ